MISIFTIAICIYAATGESLSCNVVADRIYTSVEDCRSVIAGNGTWQRMTDQWPDRKAVCLEKTLPAWREAK